MHESFSFQGEPIGFRQFKESTRPSIGIELHRGGVRILRVIDDGDPSVSSIFAECFHRGTDVRTEKSGHPILGVLGRGQANEFDTERPDQSSRRHQIQF